MVDRFGKQYTNIDSIAFDAFTISANDSLTFNQPTRALYIGETGNVHVEMVSYDGSNTEITFVNAVAGSILPIRIQKVFANTTANSLVGLF